MKSLKPVVLEAVNTVNKSTTALSSLPEHRVDRRQQHVRDKCTSLLGAHITGLLTRYSVDVHRLIDSATEEQSLAVWWRVGRETPARAQVYQQASELKKNLTPTGVVCIALLQLGSGGFGFERSVKAIRQALADTSNLPAHQIKVAHIES